MCWIRCFKVSRTSPQFCLLCSLLDPNNTVLNALGKRLPFELAVGLNGAFWVNAAEPQHVVLVSNAILNSEFLSASEATSMVDQLLKRVV